MGSTIRKGHACAFPDCESVWFDRDDRGSLTRQRSDRDRDRGTGILITGASSGIGRVIALDLLWGGHAPAKLRA
jgi:hypothetical protein